MELSKNLHIMPDIPHLYLERMRSFLGEEYQSFESCYSQPAKTGLRVNLLKIPAQQFVEIAPFKLDQVPWSPSGYVLEGNKTSPFSPGKHPYHSAGLYYLQEPSAMLVAEILAPQPGEKILDLCAAPGGKATHIVSLMQNQGLFVANEVHPQRVWDLAENLERWGAQNTVVANEKPENLANYFGPFFDKVLVDAPCSGEGLFRRNPEARAEWNLKLVESCAVRQVSILHTAAHLVRPGGVLVYSTCTFSPEENEGTVAQFLEVHPEYEIIDSPWRAHFSPGRPDWLPESGPASLQYAIRMWPHLGIGEGHFVAMLQKSEKDRIPSTRFQKKRKLPKSELDLFQRFVNENLILSLQDHQPALVGSYLYRIPEDWPDFGSLRVVHPGWWLGTMKKNRFEPAHAFAMGLERSQAQHSLNLLSTDMNSLLTYLRGENLPSGDVSGGWVLVTVDGFSLGWGKSVQGVIKNAYPRGLRWP